MSYESLYAAILRQAICDLSSKNVCIARDANVFLHGRMCCRYIRELGLSESHKLFIMLVSRIHIFREKDYGATSKEEKCERRSLRPRRSSDQEGYAQPVSGVGGIGRDATGPYARNTQESTTQGRRKAT